MRYTVLIKAIVTKGLYCSKHNCCYPELYVYYSVYTNSYLGKRLLLALWWSLPGTTLLLFLCFIEMLLKEGGSSLCHLEDHVSKSNIKDKNYLRTRSGSCNLLPVYWQKLSLFKSDKNIRSGSATT